MCVFERFSSIPDASRFSRAFAEFTALQLPARVHEALIRSQLGDQLIGHIARDSTEIEAREQPAPKAKPVSSAEVPTAPQKRGRPKKVRSAPRRRRASNAR